MILSQKLIASSISVRSCSIKFGVGYGSMLTHVLQPALCRVRNAWIRSWYGAVFGSNSCLKPSSSDTIDFERGTISVKRTVTTVSVDGKHKEIEQQSAKTKSSLRTLPLIGSFRDYFMQVKEAQELNKKICGNCYNYQYDGFVFVDEMGERMRAQYLTCSFPKFLEKHGLRRMRFHDLRHSCASLLLANGVPLKHIQEWLGHSDFTTTANIYAHLDYSSKITSAQAMETGLELPESGDFGSRWENGETQI